VPAYQYKAIDKTGRPARGGLDAVNEVDLELRLRRMGLDLITFREVEKSTGGFGAAGNITRAVAGDPIGTLVGGSRR